MPHQTNLNVSPYFDDFDPARDYHKVLFKPGYPVQARELTTLQSILSNQTELLANASLRDGSMVSPGASTYIRTYHFVRINNLFQGVPVSAYADQLVGATITGQSTAVTAEVEYILYPEDSDDSTLTFYISLGTSGNNGESTFADGELLTTNVIINSGLLGNSSIAVGSPIASTIGDTATGTGSSFKIDEGVYYVRGQLVPIRSEILLLNQYDSNPSYRVGLRIVEEIINADLDETLNDNSQGFNNYAASGADRLKITASLFKKDIDDSDDNDFIHLGTFHQGVPAGHIQSYVSATKTGLQKQISQQTGNYSIEKLDVTVHESLDNNTGNDGLWQKGGVTASGEQPTDKTITVGLGPGKTNINGETIETNSPTYIDIEKPRTTKAVIAQSLPYNTGTTLKLNRARRSPQIGVGNSYYVSLRDKRQGSNQDVAYGSEIGLARVYDYRLASPGYGNTFPSSYNPVEWGISLYDVTPFTKITLNQEIASLPASILITGADSGATAIVKDAVSAGSTVTLYEQQGNFIKYEKLIASNDDGSVSESALDGRVAVAISEYSLSDVRSVYATDDNLVGINTFNADVVSKTGKFIGISSISVVSSTGVSTVKSPVINFTNDVKPDNIISWTDTRFDVPIYARVVSVGSSEITFTAVQAVDGVNASTLPAAVTQTTDLKILTADLIKSEDNSLYTLFPKANVSSIDETTSSLTIRKLYSVDITNGNITDSTLPTAGDGETFLPFTPQRYYLTGKADGFTRELTASNVDIGDGKTLRIGALGYVNTTGARLVATLSKANITSKVKLKNRVQSIIINKSKFDGSGIGATTLNNGLTYGNYPYGTRVEDETISLNTPDIVDIHGIYESSDTSAATAPRLTLTTINSSTGTTSDYIVGEKIQGALSTVVAIVAEKISNTVISIIYKSDSTFTEGETIISFESGIEATISSIDATSHNVSSNYTFSNGQRKTFYDFGSIKRNKTQKEPARQLKVYFSSGYYSTTDTGDITNVNSYRNYNYSTEIPSVDGISNSDMVDIRPRVTDYTVSDGSRSPLEFLGRTMNAAGSTAQNVLASKENLFMTYSYYLGRIDSIYLTETGQIQVKYGTPSDRPQPPDDVNRAMNIATISLPPYLYDVDQVSVKLSDNDKLYQMKDIKKLEDRIQGLESFTSLSMLEGNTSNMFISDKDGLNRFKSGFFVDNFNSFGSQDDTYDLNNSIDKDYKELRPKHYTNIISSQFGPLTGNVEDEDLLYPDRPIQGINVRKTNDILTLDYREEEYINQVHVTHSQKVNQFGSSFHNGIIELCPASDYWANTSRLRARNVNIEGGYSGIIQKIQNRYSSVNNQDGFISLIWNSWQTFWTGESTKSKDSFQPNYGNDSNLMSGFRNIKRNLNTTVPNFTKTSKMKDISSSLNSEASNKETISNRNISRDLYPFVRPRNIEFYAKCLKPETRMYAFFDGKDVTKYCVPKLIEIEMLDGSFEAGESVFGYNSRIGLYSDIDKGNYSGRRMCFRAAQSNHLEGPYNRPTKTILGYGLNEIQNDYTSTSIVINVDTYASAKDPFNRYFGYAVPDMILYGTRSNAIARVTNVRLRSSGDCSLKGYFAVPNPNDRNMPRFVAGTKPFTLNSDPLNDTSDSLTIAEDRFYSIGLLNNNQDSTSIRSLRYLFRRQFSDSEREKALGTEFVNSSALEVFSGEKTGDYETPLSQLFRVDESKGIFVTSCSIPFMSKPQIVNGIDIPVTLQIRTVEYGKPSQKILPFSEVVLNSEDVIETSEGSTHTSFEFKAPVYLEGNGKEYAICLSSFSTKYSVAIAKNNSTDLISGTKVYNAGRSESSLSLFKPTGSNSQLIESKDTDLSYILYRAEFAESGSTNVYNPVESEAGNSSNIPVLEPNALSMVARTIRVGLGTTVGELNSQNSGSSTTFEKGNKFTQSGTQASGIFAGIGASILNNHDSLVITNPGIGYTPSAFISDQAATKPSQGYDNVPLVSLTGYGRGATANLTITYGSLAGIVTVISGGVGYKEGDVVGVATVGLTSTGQGIRLTVAGVGHSSAGAIGYQGNEILLTNVQGEFVTGVGKTMWYTNSAGTLVELNLVNGGDVTPDNIAVVNDGLHIKVDHNNHGMYFNDNRVSIQGVPSDVAPTRLTSAINYSTDRVSIAGNIDLESVSNFTSFEGVGVGTTNCGYIQIDDEVLSYTGITGNSLTGVTRATLLNATRSRVSNGIFKQRTPVYKYECGGVNLARINNTHNLNDVTISNPITYDSYHIKLDMSKVYNPAELSGGEIGNDVRNNDVGYPALYINKTTDVGGHNTRATQNLPFELITPLVTNLTVPGTSLSAEIRTVTSQSISGTEAPYLDGGFEPIILNETNYFDSPRMVYSTPNETANLSNFTGNRSLNMNLILSTTDTKLSPVIDTQRIAWITTSNRVNNLITDYITDNRVNIIDEDPTAFQYISKEITLENSASSIKIYANAHINPYSEIRAFYAVSDTEGFNPIFTPFPGYDNIDDNGDIINSSMNSGLSDIRMEKAKSNSFESEDIDFREYVFTIDSLPTFRSYKIKLAMTSTSQVYVPRLKDLRVVALA